MSRAGVEARVDRELVQRVEAVGRLLAAERREVLAGLVEAMDVVAGVAVGHVDVAVRRDVEPGEQQRQLIAPRVAHLVLIGNRRRSDRHHDVAVERHLDDRLAAQRGAVDELARRRSLRMTKPWKSLGAPLTLRRNLPSGAYTCSPAAGSCTLTYTSPAELTATSPCWLPSCARPSGSFNQLRGDRVVAGGRRGGDAAQGGDESEKRVLHDGAIMARS